MTLLTLAILGLVGGALIGGTSQTLADNETREQYRHQSDINEKEKNRALNYLDTQYETEKAQAQRTADKQDLQTTVSEALMSGSLNNDIASLGLQQQALGENLSAANLSAGAGYGSDLAGLAASGTRSSSQAAAVDMQAAVNASQLQAQEDSARKQGELSLAGVLNNVASGNFSLQQSRDDAMQLRADYEDGGLAYKAYQARRENVAGDYDLKQAELDYQYGDNGRYWNNGNVTARYLNAMFHGASTGAALAYNVGETGNNKGWWNLG